MSKLSLRSLHWRVLDPILLKLRSRLEHLELHHPTNTYLELWHQSAQFDASVKITPEADIANHDKPEALQIGAYSCIRGQLLIIAPGGRLTLGNHCYVGPGSRIWAQQLIEIGNRVLIAHLVDIHDTNAHSLNSDLRRQDPINLFERNQPIDFDKVRSRPVTIEDDVWIGFKSSILKGVHIGKGAVIGACSVVRTDVAPYTLVAGNPAVVVRTLRSED